jgi:Spy/CpxP family protein refolding chaperone
MQRRKFLVGLAGLTAVALLIGAAWATVEQAGADGPPAAPQGQAGHDGPAFGLIVPGLVPQQVLGRLANRLGLTAEQRRTINGYFQEARPQFEQLHSQLAANAELLAGTRPDDASYASIVANVSQAAAELAGQLVLQGSQLRSRVFGVLNDDQKAKLVQLQLQMQGGLEQRRAAWRHAPPSVDASPRPD